MESSGKKLAVDIQKMDEAVLGRVRQEREELSVRLDKLTLFLRLERARQTLDDTAYTLLLQQHGAMHLYLNVLDFRIAHNQESE